MTLREESKVQFNKKVSHRTQDIIKEYDYLNTHFCDVEHRDNITESFHRQRFILVERIAELEEILYEIGIIIPPKTIQQITLRRESTCL